MAAMNQPPKQSDGVVGGSELRQRLPEQPAIPQQAENPDAARDTVRSLNDEEDKKDDERDKRTYGRTPSGIGM